MRRRPVEQLATGIDALAGADVAALDDTTLREQLLALYTLTNRLHAELVRRVDVFDRRGLAEPDGFRTTKGWLQGFGRMPAIVAHRLVKAARMLRRLPKLAAAVQSGEVPAEHVQEVARLADQITVERVVEVEPVLAGAAAVLDLPRFTTVYERVKAHVDPDGPDPATVLDQRRLSVTAVEGMVLVRGQLDQEGGAALMTALDAVMAPPAEDDQRTAGQRRAGALVELARRPLASGSLPSIGGQRPQVGVLLYPQALSPKTLQTLAEVHRDHAAGQRLREFLTEPAASADWTRPGVTVDRDDLPTRAAGRTRQAMLADLRGEAPAGADLPRAGPPPPPPPPAAGAPAWNLPGWADPPFLDWVGPVPPAVAVRRRPRLPASAVLDPPRPVCPGPWLPVAGLRRPGTLGGRAPPETVVGGRWDQRGRPHPVVPMAPRLRPRRRLDAGLRPRYRRGPHHQTGRHPVPPPRQPRRVLERTHHPSGPT